MPHAFEGHSWVRRSTVGAAGTGLIIAYLLLFAIDLDITLMSTRETRTIS